MAITKKAWLIALDGSITRLPQLEGHELHLSETYDIIGNGCDIAERVQLKKGVDMWVDEEGLLKENYINLKATRMYQEAYKDAIFPSAEELGVVGNAIVIDNTKDGDFITV